MSYVIIFNMRISGYAQLAIVGVAAAVAVFAVTQSFGLEKSMSLQALDNTYAAYIAKYGKSYGTKAEYELRRSLFQKSLEEMVASNSQNSDMYRLGIN